jgi:demethylmenaquinone methyltransferase/2-methoxy-6-polyprenyl-1,4-benzoquinol methylase
MSADRKSLAGKSAEAPRAKADSPDKTPATISAMFDAIAGRYDLLNTVLSGGLDRYWRRRAIATLQLTGRERLLDVCTGTADVAIGAARGGAARVLGIDFSGAMLTHGLDKIRNAALGARVTLVRGDAMNLPVASGSVDAATIAFGIRNVQQPDVACRELHRVLRPGGRIAILEFGTPSSRLFGPVYHWYSRNVLPQIGRAVSRHDAAYTYLPESIGSFLYGDEFARILTVAGFSQVEARPMVFGAVYLYTGQKT